MRNMSFFKTQDQIRNGTKTVTRRLGWKFLKPGDEVMACVKCRGLKKSEKVEKIRPIRIVSVDRQCLFDMSINDLTLEGFPFLSTWAFVEMFCDLNKCDRHDFVTRIEFEYIRLNK